MGQQANSVTFPVEPPAWVEALVNKMTHAKPLGIKQNTIAAFEDPPTTTRIKSEIQQLKEQMFDRINNLDRQMDARIRGLVRQNQ